MYGLKVHQAVLDRAKTTGCTVHFVDNQYDHGPSSCSGPCQFRTPTQPSPSSRVSEAEREAYPRPAAAAADRVSVHGQTVTIK
jgi:phosphoribosylglycinamide formyltransferase-1